MLARGAGATLNSWLGCDRPDTFFEGHHPGHTWALLSSTSSLIECCQAALPPLGRRDHAVRLTAVSGRNNLPSPMPIYEYRCTKCRKRFSYEQTISAHDKRRPTCPKCKSRAVEPIFSTFFAKTGRKS